jgi:hypothetical protein
MSVAMLSTAEPLVIVLAILAAALFTTNLLLWRILMDVATLLSKLSSLSSAVDSLIAQATPVQIDLQPVADAIDAVTAKVSAALTPPA